MTLWTRSTIVEPRLLLTSRWCMGTATMVLDSAARLSICWRTIPPIRKRCLRRSLLSCSLSGGSTHTSSEDTIQMLIPVLVSSLFLSISTAGSISPPVFSMRTLFSWHCFRETNTFHRINFEVGNASHLSLGFSVLAHASCISLCWPARDPWCSIGPHQNAGLFPFSFAIPAERLIE